MRKVKFRGKRVDNGEWVFGGIFIRENEPKKIFIIEDSWTEPDPLYKTKDGSEIERWIFDEVEVIPETVGQFTGLRDKNGVDIYEGDKIFYDTICGYDEKDLKYCAAIVEFLHGAFSPIFFAKRELHDFDDKPQIVKNIEVIGNKWDEK